ncbi:csc1-like protein [Quercus suber]|uniref:Csc1-like protein n=1 Tax=Quercus suber TaxID=58331 RepID=A0AAW0KK13_QUESU
MINHITKGSPLLWIRFLFVINHRRIPGPTALFTKLLAIWHATCREITRHCGANATQFLQIKGRSFVRPPPNPQSHCPLHQAPRRLACHVSRDHPPLRCHHCSVPPDQRRKLRHTLLHYSPLDLPDSPYQPLRQHHFSERRLVLQNDDQPHRQRLSFALDPFPIRHLRNDHRRIPNPIALFTKLLAVWHATCHEISGHCDAAAAQFLQIEGGSFAILSSISFLSIFLILPINLYTGIASLNDDQFFKTTINHIVKGSPLLWIHFLFVMFFQKNSSEF